MFYAILLSDVIFLLRARVFRQNKRLVVRVRFDSNSISLITAH